MMFPTTPRIPKRMLNTPSVMTTPGRRPSAARCSRTMPMRAYSIGTTLAGGAGGAGSEFKGIRSASGGLGDGGKVHSPLAGRQVLVDSVFPDVFDVDVGDVLGVVADDLGGVLAAAEQVAAVAVHLERRLVPEELVLELEVLRRGLDEEARLGL